MPKEVDITCSPLEWFMKQPELYVTVFGTGIIRYIFCSVCTNQLGKGYGEAMNALQESLKTEGQEKE